MAGFRTLLRSLLFLTWMSMFFSANGQNLVPNYSFEMLTSCPFGPSLLCENYAPPWVCANGGTSDLYNACSPQGPGSVNVPDNSNGFQNAITGQGYAGILCRIGNNGREYLQTPLTSPLIADQWYHVSFYVSKVEEFPCAIEHIGAYFTQTDFYFPTWNYIDAEPQVESDFGFLTDTANWIFISGCFQAEGGEAYITIGNFRSDAESPMDPNCNGSTYSYYYVEDVVVQEGPPPEELFFDLPDEAEACLSYEIDPNHQGPYFHWSDGSSGPTLLVENSGHYILTITDGCSEGIDSIDVTILGHNPPVDLGPENITICEGDSYTITLDPDLFYYEWSDGSTGSSIVIDQPGIYAVTLDDGCTASTDMIEISVLSAPSIFDLGDDFLICQGDEVLLTLDPSLGDIMWQDGSTAPTFEVNGPGIYGATISNMCGQVSDQIVATLLDIPQIDLGSEDIPLCTGDILQYNFDPQLGEYLWQDGSTTPDYTIDGAGIYSVTLTNMCGADFDEVVIQEVETPSVDLGPDLSGCAGDTFILSPDLSDVDFLWQDQSTESSITITHSGIYAVTVTNICGADEDAIEVLLSPVIPPVDLGPDLQLCPGEVWVFEINASDGIIEWQDLSDADTLLVSTSGLYWVTVSNTCSLVTDTVNVTINANPPQLNLPTSLTLCEGDSILLEAGLSGVQYEWSGGAQTSQLAVYSPGIYSLTVTNACGADTDTTIISDGGTAPVIQLGADVQLCPGDTIHLQPLLDPLETWMWSNGSTDSDYNITDTDTITIMVMNACGTAEDTLFSTLLPPAPTPDLGTDTSICAQDTITLSVSMSDVSILWSDGSSQSEISVATPGQFFVEVSNICGSGTDSIWIFNLPSIPALDLGADQFLCPGETILIDPEVMDVDYIWQDGSTDPFYSTQLTGTITLTISNACGTSSDTMQIIESTEGPMVDLGPDIRLCDGESTVLQAGIAGVAYEWQDGSTSPGLLVSVSGTYILHVSNACGTDSDTIAVQISGTAPSIDLGVDTVLCSGLTFVLHAEGDAETLYTWQDGTQTDSMVVQGAGEYFVQASHPCGSSADTIIVLEQQPPLPFTLGPDLSICEGDSVWLIAPSVQDEWMWQDGSQDTNYIATTSGMFILEYQNICGFTADTIVITTDMQVPQIAFDTTQFWCIGETILLDALQPFEAMYNWSTGATTPSIQITQPDIIYLTIASLCQTREIGIHIAADPDCKIETGIFIPNIISPNQDHINDVFVMSWGSDIIPIEISGAIYDRWGNMLFSSEQIPFSWDPEQLPNPAMPGVYVYQIKCKYAVFGVEKTEVFTGDVTIIK